MDVKGHYRTLRELGYTRRSAARQALVDSVANSDLEQVRQGITYEPAHVRLAVVHTRQDLVLAIADIGEIGETLRSIRRWLACGVILLALVALGIWG